MQLHNGGGRMRTYYIHSKGIVSTFILQLMKLAISSQRMKALNALLVPWLSILPHRVYRSIGQGQRYKVFVKMQSFIYRKCNQHGVYDSPLLVAPFLKDIVTKGISQSRCRFAWSDYASGIRRGETLFYPIIVEYGLELVLCGEACVGQIIIDVSPFAEAAVVEHFFRLSEVLDFSMPYS